jgi:hypothetical protein
VTADVPVVAAKLAAAAMSRPQVSTETAMKNLRIMCGSPIRLDWTKTVDSDSGSLTQLAGRNPEPYRRKNGNARPI